MNKQLSEALQVARVVAFHEFPYYARALASLNFYETDEVDTLAVDQHLRCYVNAEYFLSLPQREQVGVLVHETLHPTMNHSARCEAIFADRAIWNIAADAEINDGPKLKKWLPKDCVHPSQFDCEEGEPAEFYYTQLNNGPPQPPPPPHVPGEDKGTEPGGQPGGPSNRPPGEQETQQPGGQGHSSQPGETSHKPAGGKCGSCAHGEAEPHEAPPPDQGGDPGLDKAEVDLIRRGTAMDIANASATHRGDVGAGMVRWANEQLRPPTIPWQRHLVGAVKDCVTWQRGSTEPTFQRPHRRWMPGDEIILPSRRDPSIEVAVLVDTSGSMSTSDLTDAMSEIQGILKKMNGKQATILSCDAKVYAETIKRVTRVADITLAGGGGTNMCVGIKAACAMKPNPDILIVATDCETPWPDKAPKGTRVIVLGVGVSSWGKSDVPTWAKYVEVK